MTFPGGKYGSTRCENSGEFKEQPGLKRSASIWSCDFESAIDAAGFGKFNVFLVIVAVFTGLIAVFEPRSNAYIVPAAQCDLHLDISQKALLNSIPLAGMVLTSFLWGFMGDTLGRQKLIMIICFLDFTCWIMAAAAQSFQGLLVARFLGGMVSSGIYPSLVSYLSEIHGVRHRAIMQLFMGNIFGLGDLLLPVMALSILPSENTYQIASMVIHPWNIYLLICSMVPFISGIGFILLPESPKFLMSRSQNEKAIDVFQCIYNINTCNSTKQDYPVKSLKNIPVDSKQKESPGRFGSIGSFLQEHNLRNLILSMMAQCFIIMGFNCILLWLPQIFQEMANHQRTHNGSATVCETLMDIEFKTNNISGVCEEDMSQNIYIYMYCMIVASATILLFGITGCIINFIGKKCLLYILGTLSAVAAILLLFSENILATLILTSLICAFGNIGFNALVAIVVDIFPTNLRAMSVSLTMMTGRLGGVLGSFAFPMFLPYGCTDALVFIALVNLAGASVVYLLPDSENVDRKNEE